MAYTSLSTAKILALAGSIMLQPSCAVSYTDNKGNQHIIGFAHIEITADQTVAEIAGNAVTVSNIGVLLSSHEKQKSLSVGYTSETIIYLKNNILIGLPEAGHLQAETSKEN
jgi:hypothetical protein